ncbi:MAG: hypothetical protein ACLFNW_12825 [Desulfobacterales bacterium]
MQRKWAERAGYTLKELKPVCIRTWKSPNVDFIEKPFSIKGIVSRVREILGQ